MNSPHLDNLPRKKFDVYLASPYSHENAAVREARFMSVAKCAAWAIHDGKTVFCPITHSHPIQVHGQFDAATGWKYWKQIDETAIDNCKQLWVLCIDGWQASEGVRAEIEYAKKRGMSIWYVCHSIEPGFAISNSPNKWILEEKYERLQRKVRELILSYSRFYNRSEFNKRVCGDLRRALYGKA